MNVVKNLLLAILLVVSFTTSAAEYTAEWDVGAEEIVAATGQTVEQLQVINSWDSSTVSILYGLFKVKILHVPSAGHGFKIIYLSKEDLIKAEAVCNNFIETSEPWTDKFFEYQRKVRYIREGYITYDDSKDGISVREVLALSRLADVISTVDDSGLSESLLISNTQ